MGRRRRRKESGPEQAVIGLALLLGGWTALSRGGSPQVLLQSIVSSFIFFGLVGAALYAIVRVWTTRRFRTGPIGPSDAARTRDSPSAGRSPPDILDSLRSRQEPVLSADPQNAPLLAWSMDTIAALEWKRFEELCQGFWKAKGYRAELSGPGADGGVDVFIRDRQESTKNFAVIQCKSWSSRVGVEPVRALWGAKDHFAAKLAIFYSLSGFTPDAIAFARAKHLKLIGGEELLQQLERLPADQRARLLSHVTRGDYRTPTCPRCDTKMVLRRGHSDFWGCSNYPRCHFTMKNGRLRTSQGRRQ